MKRTNLNILVIIAFSLLGFVGCGSTESQKEKDHSESITSILDNDYAKVVKVTLEPGQSLQPHVAEERVIYSLNSYSIEWKEEGLGTTTKNWEQGDVHSHIAGEHSAKNIGETTAEWLVVIRKDAKLPECSENSINEDVNTVAEDYAAVLFDDDTFMITEVNLPAGKNIPMHSGINRVIYSLSDYQILYETNNEEQEKSFSIGEAHWHDACSHALENIGATEAKFLVISFKK